MPSLLLLIFPTFLFAEIISPKLILEKVESNYPLIKAAKEKVNKARGKNLSAEGVFDIELYANKTNREEGYYLGDVDTIGLRKRFPWLKSELIVESIQSNDHGFPTYQEYLAYSENGSTKISLSFNLLRDLTIDKDRLKRLQTKLGISLQEMELTQKILDYTYYAFKSYLNWLMTVEQTQAYEELVKTSEERLSIVERKAKAGSLPLIYREEANQYLMQNKNLLNFAKEELYTAQTELAVFLSDERFLQFAREFQAPTLYEVYSKLNTINFPTNLDNFWNIDPRFQQFQVEREVLMAELDYGENQELPELKIKLENHQNVLILEKETDESKISATVSLPLARSQARGLQAQAKSKIAILNQQQNLYQQEIKSRWLALTQKIKLLQKRLENTSEQINAATKLLAAENSRFLAGDSDYFLINIREQQLIKAKVDQIKLKKSLMTSWVKLLHFNRDLSGLKNL